ncbi:MAG: M23 family metallopeptidase [Thermoleophilia bacterium]
MLKRKWMLSAVVTSVILAVNPLPGSASAACGGEPPLPPEGLTWPASGQIIKAWSLNCSTDSGHRGVDVALPEGTSIGAAADGVVSFVGYTPAEGGGTTVSITHDTGLKSTYLHIYQVTVHEGTRVRQGDPIGLSNGAPMHFGIKLPGAREIYFDPTLYLADASTVQAVQETVPPQENPVPFTADKATAAPAGTGVDVATATAATVSTSTNPISNALNKPSDVLREQRNPTGVMIATTVPALTPLQFPLDEVVRQPALMSGSSPVLVPPLSFPGKLFESNIPPTTNDIRPAQSRYEKPVEGKLLPFRNSIVPLVTTLLIAAIIMRGRKMSRLPSVRTA